jgi:hypothetical protein
MESLESWIAIESNDEDGLEVVIFVCGTAESIAKMKNVDVCFNGEALNWLW